ncbi:DUF2796 domain-containing protein [uncultured Roseobacter sp.]|uniref:zinc uptake protein ZrgA n=1 Tax=uncultured Roseobacter sp. TaxID=114847 RepID=UPI00261E03CA|nr:DUF2796 domain-containing protein [uncultured Roseobacter sp.]
MKQTVSLIAFFAALPALAEETRQMDAHEHGVGALNIAVDGTTVLMELTAPGADIVGFEYAASSAEDRRAVDAAVAALATPMDLFVVPAAAGCSVTAARAALELEEAHEDHDGDAHGHDDHAHDDAHGHDDHDDHDDHAAHKDEHNHDDHAAHADEHDQEEHADGGSHSEFHATYQLTCADPQALDQIEFAYFDRFENALELEVQIVTGSGAQAFEVLRTAPVLDLRNLF